MAWRIADSVVRGEIDNRLPGIIKGTLYLDGLTAPVILELEGDCDPDLAGRHLTFRNLRPAVSQQFDGFKDLQGGDAGTMTGNRMVRIPIIPEDEVTRCIEEHKQIPTRWSESLYLEWFGPNGRVLIEGASFACQLSAAKWTLTDEAHEWRQHLKIRFDCGFSSDYDDDEGLEADEPPTASTGGKHPFALSISTVNGQQPHPIVKRVAEFLLQMIGEGKVRRFFTDKEVANQPLEGMFEATNRATIRLAHAMAKVAEHVSRQDSQEIVRDLRRARWSLAQASDLAGLARHMGSAESHWLSGLRREFGRLRKEITRLIHEYADGSPELAPASTGSLIGSEPGKSSPD